MGAVSGCLSAGSANQILPKKKKDDDGIYDTRRLLSELITVQTAIVFTDTAASQTGPETKDSLAYTLRSIAELSGRIGRNNTGGVGGKMNVKDQGALPGITEAPSTLSHSSGSRFEIRQEHNIDPSGTVSVVSIQSR